MDLVPGRAVVGHHRRGGGCRRPAASRAAGRARGSAHAARDRGARAHRRAPGGAAGTAADQEHAVERSAERRRVSRGRCRGKFTLQPTEAGQPLLIQNLVSISAGAGGTITTTSRLAALLPDDKIGVVLPAGDLLSKSGEVSTGDHVDVLASLSVASATEGKGGQVTLMTLQNVPVIKTLQEASGKQDQPGPITGLVVAVDPQDAVTLKYFVDAGANVSIGLRPPKLTTIFDILPETINYIADKFGIKPPELLP